MDPKPDVAEVVAVPKEKTEVVAPNAGWVVLFAPKDGRAPVPLKGVCEGLPKAGWAAGWEKLK